MEINLDTLYRPPRKGDHIEWLIPYRNYTYSSRVRRANDTREFRFLDFGSPVVVMRDVSLLQGRYPLDGSSTLWLDGIRYYQNSIELQGSAGGSAITPTSIAALMRSLDSPVSKNLKKAILIGGRDNFGHFLFEFLTKFHVASCLDLKDCTFLVSSSTPPRFLEYCYLLGISPEDITLFNETDHLFIQELIVPAISAHRHVRTGDICVDRDVFLEMRGRLVAASMSDLKGLPPRENHSIEILYVSRAMERWRRVVNEEDVIRAISKFGSVEILDPKLLSASAQIDVFRRSRLVVSPLGGASPTTMFCKAGTDIVELSSPLLKGDWGHRVWAGLFDLGHLRLEGVIDGCRNDGALPIDQDFSLPIDRLSVAMTKLFGD